MAEAAGRADAAAPDLLTSDSAMGSARDASARAELRGLTWKDVAEQKLNGHFRLVLAVRARRPMAPAPTAAAQNDGGMQDGLRSGFGIYTYANGAAYRGEYVSGQKHGYGMLVFANGDSYEGYGARRGGGGGGADDVRSDFRGGRQHGRGKYASADGLREYVGDWAGARTRRGAAPRRRGADGLQAGHGRYTVRDDSGKQDVYEGCVCRA
jgi:hypothetical protein